MTLFEFFNEKYEDTTLYKVVIEGHPNYLWDTPKGILQKISYYDSQILYITQIHDNCITFVKE